MNSAYLIRLTKGVVAVAATVLSLGASDVHAACGGVDARATRAEQRATIALQDLETSGPVYYWHDSSTYSFLYFRPEDMLARLEALLASEQGSDHDSRFGNATLVPALLDNIKVDLPLKESTDLFRYSIIDQRFDAVLSVVIAELMEEGKVMLDQWVFVEQPEKSIVMVSREDGDEEGRWFCTPDDNVLFRG